ncbi:hypothetical protein SDC9_58325 [bioreactor metagenome]|uniref:Uncharacterized protein n=1 Tax=bioreactor metagenome TaxID=1076179 RepID=A0A644XCR1_9ZZZZ
MILVILGIDAFSEFFSCRPFAIFKPAHVNIAVTFVVTINEQCGPIPRHADTGFVSGCIQVPGNGLHAGKN